MPALSKARVKGRAAPLDGPASGWRPGQFAARIIGWQRRHGRHGLPWQQTRDPYRVWLSEIMLQQTRVATVLAYYPRFLARFPGLQALAAASLDEVLALWSGLGYYSRARLLHRCACQLVAEHGGRFPETVEGLSKLPGIGRSTAGAIAAFCFGARSAILDGNVRRVLARVFAIDGDLGRGMAQQALWRLAEGLLPATRLASSMPAYTQGLMDLGATLCLARKPDCARCPLADRCRAFALGDPGRYPARRARAQRPAEALWLLLAQDGMGRVWLVRRPAGGIWARLHCLPALPTRAAALALLPQPARTRAVQHPMVRHLLTHRELQLHVLHACIDDAGQPVDAAGAWHASSAWRQLGLPAPVRRILDALGP